MSIFKKAVPEMAFVKMGLYGKAGSGKTYTSSKVAIGLAQLIKDPRPVAFIDTETGSDFVRPMFEEAKVELVVAKSRAFEKLVQAVDEAEKEASVLIIDSITHFWYEIVRAYMSENNISRMAFHHWGPVKEEWRRFADRYVNSRLHIIMAGRAGDVWEDTPDEQGIMESKRVGTRMKAEVETGYEPSLLVEMVREYKDKKKGATWTHRAYVMKDRFDLIDGKAFDDPGLEQFMPHVLRLNLGGEHRGVDTDTSQGLFTKDDSKAKFIEHKKTLLEKIQNEVYLLHPSASAEDKKARLELMRKIFGTHAWNEIAGSLKLEALESGLSTLETMTGTKPAPVSDKDAAF